MSFTQANNNTAPTNTTNATFRLWGTAIRDAILNSGFTMVGTGNVDWTTVAVPAVTTAAGFEVYQFNDTLQATNPYFFKLEYGTASILDRPALWLTVGRGHNGTGTITANGGALTTRAQIGKDLASNTQNCWCYFAGQSSANAGYMCMALWTHKTNTTSNASIPRDINGTFATLVSFERTKDSTGADTSDGLLLLYTVGASAYRMQYVGNTANGNVETTLGVLVPGNAGLNANTGTATQCSARTGSRWGFYPVFHNKKGAMLYPGKNVMVAYNSTFGDDLTMHYGEMWSPTQYGAQRTLVYHGDTIFTSCAPIARMSQANTTLLTRFD